MLNDIRTREDVERLVESFYAQATTDDTIGHLFTDVAQVDFVRHLPLMYDFWETLLFGVRKYKGNAMRAHFDLNEKVPLVAEHFQRWLQIWERTVDALFAGENAESAKDKARYIARSIQLRLSAATAARIENAGVPVGIGTLPVRIASPTDVAIVG
ncbi:group III truncated hemoglobin [Longimicrobium sp.]|jgi:hemoglobin|uniref:group III truncated hemoglobin n=1 Tax=Longimicrobium sp. TaxID=2029185 RepID=UPI002ED7B156